MVTVASVKLNRLRYPIIGFPFRTGMTNFAAAVTHKGILIIMVGFRSITPIQWGMHPRLNRHPCRSSDNFVVVESANIAKTLGYNEFRRACPQRLFVDQVESFARFQKLPDFAIDLLARKTMAIDGTLHHDGFLLCIGRIIALMSDADDLIAKTERKRDFRRAGE